MSNLDFTIRQRGSSTSDSGLTTYTARVEELEEGELQLGAAYAAELERLVAEPRVEPAVQAQALLRLHELAPARALPHVDTCLATQAPDRLAANALVVLAAQRPTDMPQRLARALTALDPDEQPGAFRNLTALLLQLERAPSAEALPRLEALCRNAQSSRAARGRALELLAHWDAPGWLELALGAYTTDDSPVPPGAAASVLRDRARALPREQLEPLLVRLYQGQARGARELAVELAEAHAVDPRALATVFAPPSDEGATPLDRALRAAGLDASSLRPFREVEGQAIFALEVPAHEALAAWKAARPAVEDLGLYPVLCAGSEWPHDPTVDSSPSEILRRADTYGTPAWDAWRDELRAAHEAELQSSLTSAPEWVRERIPRWVERVLQIEVPEPAEEVGAWPNDAPRPQPQPPWLPDEVALSLAFLPGPPGDAPAWLAFGHFNQCPRSEEHVLRLRRWHERYGAVPYVFGGECLALRVARPPASRDAALDLAAEHAHYCPSDAGPSARYAASLMHLRTWFFWWD